MKLAEALQLRAEYQNKSERLRKRICDNLKVLLDEEPVEERIRCSLSCSR